MGIDDLDSLGRHWKVDLRWTRPRLVDGDDASLVLPEEAWQYRGVYRFCRTHHLQVTEGDLTQRIGIAYAQSIGTRVSQYERDFILALRGKGRLFISYALLVLERETQQHRRARYEGVEHLLCFVTQPPFNDKKTKTPPREGWYHVCNNGSRGDLPREVRFPALLYSY